MALELRRNLVRSAQCNLRRRSPLMFVLLVSCASPVWAMSDEQPAITGVGAETAVQTPAQTPAVAAEPTTSKVAEITDDETIVVTARKRVEKVQDVPFSIRALSEQELRRLGADSLEDYAGVTPGLQITGDRTSAQLIIRGVTAGPVNQDQAEIKETVGLYLDETPIAVQRFSPNLKLYDLERIEVLRGPQGTLYGAGSMAGAIRMITRKPQSDSFGAETRMQLLDISDGDMSYSLDGMLNIPLVKDKLAIRAVGFYRGNGGYIDNVVLPDRNANSEKSLGGRLAVRLTPTPDLTVDGLLYYQRSNYRASSAFTPVVGDLNTNVARNEPQKDRNFMASLTATQSLGFGDVTFVGSYRRKEFEYFLEGGSFTNFVTGFRDGLGGGADSFSNQKDYSTEVRLASKPDSWLQWTAGIFFEDKSNFFSQDITVPGVDAISGLDSRLFGAAQDQLFFSDIQLDETQVAAFGEVVFPITEALKLTAGGRYFQAKQKAEITFLGVFAFPNIGTSDFRNKEDGFNPRVNLSYEITPDHLVYAQAARGFRLGGTNEPVPASCAADLAARGLSSAPQGYESDHLWNYEVGAKTQWLDRKLTLNASVYRIDWRNPQVTAQLGCGFNVYVNAGGLKIWGGELEAVVRPAAGLTLRGGVG